MTDRACGNTKHHGFISFICDRPEGHDGNHQQKTGLKVSHWWVNTCDHICTSSIDATGHRSCLVCRKSHEPLDPYDLGV